MEEDLGNLEECQEMNVASSQKKKRVFGVGDQGRCTKQRAKKSYSKKRKYHPPQNKTKKTETEHNTSSTSHKKVTDVNLPDSSLQKEAVEGYRLLEMSVFAKLLCDLLCPECYESQLSVSTDTVKRKGLASYVSIK